LKVKITHIEKKDNKVLVTISHPSSSSTATLIFDTLSPELAEEFFSTATKEEMDSLRGAPLG